MDQVKSAGVPVSRSTCLRFADFFGEEFLLLFFLERCNLFHPTVFHSLESTPYQRYVIA
jgi:hypothetical protein